MTEFTPRPEADLVTPDLKDRARMAAAGIDMVLQAKGEVTGKEAAAMIQRCRAEGDSLTKLFEATMKRVGCSPA